MSEHHSPSADQTRLAQKIIAHANTLLTRQVADLTYAKGQFSTYDRATFQASFDGSTPEERDLANRVVGAFDAAMNDLNEVLRNAYGLAHGYRKVGPSMPTVYFDLPLTHRDDLDWVNNARNGLTHDYPATTAGEIFDAIAEFERVIKKTLGEANAFAKQHGVAIPGIP
jgi:hypothetical protein